MTNSTLLIIFCHKNVKIYINYSDSKEVDPYLYTQCPNTCEYKLQLSQEPFALSVLILSSYQKELLSRNQRAFGSFMNIRFNTIWRNIKTTSYPSKKSPAKCPLANCPPANCPGFDHITQVLRALHWLPIPHRIEYKIILLCFKAIHGLSPGCISDLDTRRLVLFSKNSIGCQLNFGVFSKQPLWFIRFFTVVIQTISALICLFVTEGMAQDTTAQIRGSWRFRNSTHLYTNQKITLWS